MIVKIYAAACIKDGKNFNTVPDKIKDAVREEIEKEGYEILEDGTVVKKKEGEN